MKMRKKIRRGFTLVELVVVIAVIAILAGVSVGAYFGITDSTNSSNATSGQKQVTDLWYAYSLSRDFNPNASLKEKADDFCLGFLPENGPNYEVNFKEVDVYLNAQNNEQSASYKIPSILLQNDVSAESKKGLLFKIETTYPTWFIVRDDKIVETSGTVYKNDTDFYESLISSEYLKTKPTLVDDTYNYPFNIQVVGKDIEGKNVRGYAYWNVEGYRIDDEGHEVKDAINVKYGDSIKAATNGFYSVSIAKVEGSNIEYQDGSVTEKDTGVEIDTSKTLNLSKKSVFNRISDRVQIDDDKYGYYLNESVYKIRYISNKSLKDFNLTNFPILLVEYEFNSSFDPGTDTLISVVESDVEPYEARYKSGIKSKFKKVITKTFAYNIDESKTTYNFYSDIDLSYFNDTQSSNKTYFIFANNYTLDSNLLLPSNTMMILDYKAKTIEDIKLYMKTLVAKQYQVDYTYITAEMSFSIDLSMSLILDLISGKLNPASFIDKSKYPKSNDQSFNVSPTISSPTILNNDELRFNSYTNTSDRPLQTVDASGAKNNFDTNVNTLNIKNGAQLTIPEDSYLIVDSQIYIATSTKGVTKGHFAKINLTENSSIVLNGGNLKVLGEIVSDDNTGIIYSNDTSKVIETMTINDYIGGSYTTSILGGWNLLSNSKPSNFPFIDYELNNIQATIKMSDKTVYSVISVLQLSTEIIQVGPLNLLSSSNDTYHSLFESLPREGIKYTLSKSFKNGITDMIAYGGIKNGYISFDITANLGIEKTITVDSRYTEFPLTNFNFIIEETADLELGHEMNDPEFHIYPTSTLNIKGSLKTVNDCDIVLISPSDYAKIVGYDPVTDTMSNPNNITALHISNRDTYKKFASKSFESDKYMLEIGENATLDVTNIYLNGQNNEDNLFENPIFNNLSSKYSFSKVNATFAYKYFKTYSGTGTSGEVDISTIISKLAPIEYGEYPISQLSVSNKE